ncbi:MAG TPA: ABC transporter permease [Vicinamibacterales bacterium]|nr:ABC transporter permease [Vicinamibacterales bacterium]
MMWDLRLALRTLMRTPVFTAITVALLALGMGAAIAVFAVVDAVLLKALPYPEPDRIVTIWEATDQSRAIGASNPNFQDWQQAATSFASMAGWSGGTGTVVGGREPVVTGVYQVTRDFFAVMGVSPVVGRAFSAEESQEHGRPAVVVSHGFWTRLLGSNPDLAQLWVDAGGHRATVVGVMPPGFNYPPDADVWLPRELDTDTSGRTAHNVRVLARLKPGVTLASAQAEMTLIARRLEATYGADHDSTDASVIPLHERTVGTSRPMLLVLLGGVAIVLLATCANVANMVLARGTGRRRELAMRQALGAERRQLVRLLLSENLVLGVSGALGGLAIAAAFVRGLVALAPSSIPRIDQVAIDARAALAATGLALITPVVFGWLPSLTLSRTSLRDVLAEGGRGGSAGAGRARQGLVALEMAVALLMVISAGLLGRSLARLLDVDPGFQPAHVLTLQTTVPEGKYSDAAAAARLYDGWLARVTTVPGVEAAGIVNAPPLSGLDANGGFMLDGQVWDDIKDNWVAQSAVYRIASAGYFEAMGIPLRRGRWFDGRDVPGSEPAALINESLARRHFAGRDPIGQRIRFAGMDEVNPWLTVVGVVGDTRFRDLATEAVPEVFVNFRQQPMRTRYFMTTAARLAPGVTAESVVPTLRAGWRTLDPDVPVEVSRMTTLVERSTASRRFTLTVIGLFGAMALVLAAIGVYGILNHVVADRTREIGIRMALGASPRSVARLVFGGASLAVAAGVLAGVAAALGLTRFLRTFLFEISPLDAPTIIGAVGVLVAVSMLAGWQPVRRASRIDPVVVMREN